MSSTTKEEAISAVGEKAEHHDGMTAEIEAAEEVPGTIVVPANSEDGPRQALRPMPSLDPNDPLNWPRWQKYTTFFTICFFSFLATVNASNFSPAILLLSKTFHKQPSQITFLICFNTLTLGVGNLFWVPLMRKIGKRPVYLIAIFLLMVFNVWSYESKSFSSLLASRICSGFAAAAGDAPTPALVADTFFVHERGFVLMFFHLALSFGVFLGPLINSYIIEDTETWRWACGWIAIAAGVNWILAVFTIHETSYPDRNLDAPSSHYGPKRSFVQSMSLKIGLNPHASFRRSLWNIFAIAAYPPVVWCGLTVGVFMGWNIAVQLESSVLFLHPPYRWKIHDLGLLSIAGLVGTLLAMFVGGHLIDVIANTMTRRHGGRREPEYRLPAMLLPALVGPLGVLTFGLCSAHKTKWIGAAFAYGMQGFGLTAVSNILATYAVDSYHSFAGEALVFFFVSRAIIGCILALFTFDWIAATGLANAFGQMVAIQFFALLFTPVFYFKGKQIRALAMKFGPMKH